MEQKPLTMTTAAGTVITCQSLTITAQATPIHILSYQVPSPSAVFLILHGMCEHKNRYLSFMEELADLGYASVIYDHRGHGESVASPDDYGYVGSDHYDTYVEDAHQILELTKSMFPDLPVVLFGHSMGSLIARCVLKKYDQAFAACILSGPPCANGALAAGKAALSAAIKVKGGHAHSPMFDNLVLGAYDKAFPNEPKNSWTCSDPASVEAYNNDPLCGFSFTLDGYANLFYLMSECYAPKGWAMENPSLPILYLAGADDPCAGTKEDFKKTILFMKSRGYEEVHWRHYQGARHELLNEPIREQVIADMIYFLKKVMK